MRDKERSAKVRASINNSAMAAGHSWMLVPLQLLNSHESSDFRFVTRTWYKSTASFTAWAASSSACSCQKAHRTLVLPCWMMALHTMAIFSLVWRSMAPGLSMMTAATQICCRSLTRLSARRGTRGWRSGTSAHGASVNLVASTVMPSVPLRRKMIMQPVYQTCQADVKTCQGDGKAETEWSEPSMSIYLSLYLSIYLFIYLCNIYVTIYLSILCTSNMLQTGQATPSSLTHVKQAGISNMPGRRQNMPGRRQSWNWMEWTKYVNLSMSLSVYLSIYLSM